MGKEQSTKSKKQRIQRKRTTYRAKRKRKESVGRVAPSTEQVVHATQQIRETQ